MEAVSELPAVYNLPHMYNPAAAHGQDSGQTLIQKYSVTIRELLGPYLCIEGLPREPSVY